MKKFIVLTMVMAVASIASAGVVYSVNGGEATSGNLGSYVDSALLQATIDEAANAYKVRLTWDSGIVIGDISLPTEEDEELAPGFWFPQPTWAANAIVGGEIVGNSAQFTGFQAPGTVKAGKTAFEATFSGIGLVTFETIADDGSIAGTSTMNLVPEPITMALLGLGGLFIRRRK